MKLGIVANMLGTSNPDIKIKKTVLRPRKLSLAKAYPAKTANVTVPKTIAPVNLSEFQR